jgi:hypothetical protein
VKREGLADIDSRIRLKYFAGSLRSGPFVTVVLAVARQGEERRSQVD